MDPQQELFSELQVRIKALGYDVYDGGLPPDNTPYPFVYLAESRMTDTHSKTAVLGTVYQTIHVWHSKMRRRGDVSEMMAQIKRVCRSLHETKTFSWDCRSAMQQILPDTTTTTPLLHGVLDVEFALGGTRQ